jgi:ribonuclease P protein component
LLPAAARIRRRDDFSAAIRGGSRTGRTLLTGHLLIEPGAAPPRVGFVVSRAVGGAVVRNKVRRRLRELVRSRLNSLPAGSLLVVRANPRAATARQSELAAELDLVIDTLLRRQAGALSR